MRPVAFSMGERTRDTAWALLDQGATLVSATLSFLLLGRTLGASGYGAFVGLYALMGPFSALSQSGVFLTAMEHVVRSREAPADVARSCLSITVLNASLWVPLLSVVGLAWIDGLPPLAAVLLLANEFFLNGALGTSVGMVQAVSGFPAAARIRVVAAAARICVLVALAAAGSLTLTTLAVGQVAAMAATVALAAARVSRLIGAPALPGRVRRQHVRSVVLYGIQIGASNVQSDGDKFILNAAGFQADAGRYGAAYRLMQMALLPLNALVGATHLSFLREAEGGSPQVRRALRLSLVALAYSVPVVLGMVLAAPLIPMILSRDFSQTTLILQLLSPVVLLRGLWTFPMNGLMGLGRNGLRTKIQVGNAIFGLALYLWLIPRFSWRGALAAAIASEASLCVAAWVALVMAERGRPAAGAELAGPAAPSSSP